jgi:hypothetical protein
MARVFDGQREGLTRDDILDNITLYWVTNTAISAARLYWELDLLTARLRHPGAPPFAVDVVGEAAVEEGLVRVTVEPPRLRLPVR